MIADPIAIDVESVEEQDQIQFFKRKTPRRIGFSFEFAQSTPLEILLAQLKQHKVEPAHIRAPKSESEGQIWKVEFVSIWALNQILKIGGQIWDTSKLKTQSLIEFEEKITRTVLKSELTIVELKELYVGQISRHPTFDSETVILDAVVFNFNDETTIVFTDESIEYNIPFLPGQARITILKNEASAMFEFIEPPKLLQFAYANRTGIKYSRPCNDDEEAEENNLILLKGFIKCPNCGFANNSFKRSQRICAVCNELLGSESDAFNIHQGLWKSGKYVLAGDAWIKPWNGFTAWDIAEEMFMSKTIPMVFGRNRYLLLKGPQEDSESWRNDLKRISFSPHMSMEYEDGGQFPDVRELTEKDFMQFRKKSGLSQIGSFRMTQKIKIQTVALFWSRIFAFERDFSITDLGDWISAFSGEVDQKNMKSMHLLLRESSKLTSEEIDEILVDDEDDIPFPKEPMVYELEQLRMKVYMLKDSRDDMIAELKDRRKDVFYQTNVSHELFLLAARDGHRMTVKNLLAAGIDVNKQNEEGVSALHLAALNHNVTLVRILLERNADVNLRTKWKRNSTVLHAAVESGCIETIGLIIHANVNLDVVDDEGNTALHLAAKLRDQALVKNQVIKELLMNSADLNKKNEAGQIPKDLCKRRKAQHLFIEPEYDEIQHQIYELCSNTVKDEADMEFTSLLALLEKVDQVTFVEKHTGVTPLMRAVRMGNLRFVKKLIEKERPAAVDKKRNTILFYAVRSGDLNVFEYLCEAFPTLMLTRDSFGRTLLHMVELYGLDMKWNKKINNKCPNLSKGRTKKKTLHIQIKMNTLDFWRHRASQQIRYRPALVKAARENLSSFSRRAIILQNSGIFMEYGGVCAFSGGCLSFFGSLRQEQHGSTLYFIDYVGDSSEDLVAQMKMSYMDQFVEIRKDRFMVEGNQEYEVRDVPDVKVKVKTKKRKREKEEYPPRKRRKREDDRDRRSRDRSRRSGHGSSRSVNRDRRSDRDRRSGRRSRNRDLERSRDRSRDRRRDRSRRDEPSRSRYDEVFESLSVPQQSMDVETSQSESEGFDDTLPMLEPGTSLQDVIEEETPHQIQLPAGWTTKDLVREAKETGRSFSDIIRQHHENEKKKSMSAYPTFPPPPRSLTSPNFGYMHMPAPPPPQQAIHPGPIFSGFVTPAFQRDKIGPKEVQPGPNLTPIDMDIDIQHSKPQRDEVLPKEVQPELNVTPIDMDIAEVEEPMKPKISLQLPKPKPKPSELIRPSIFRTSFKANSANITPVQQKSTPIEKRNQIPDGWIKADEDKPVLLRVARKRPTDPRQRPLSPRPISPKPVEIVPEPMAVEIEAHDIMDYDVDEQLKLSKRTAEINERIELRWKHALNTGEYPDVFDKEKEVYRLRFEEVGFKNYGHLLNSSRSSLEDIHNVYELQWYRQDDKKKRRKAPKPIFMHGPCPEDINTIPAKTLDAFDQLIRAAEKEFICGTYHAVANVFGRNIGCGTYEHKKKYVLKVFGRYGERFDCAWFNQPNGDSNSPFIDYMIKKLDAGSDFAVTPSEKQKIEDYVSWRYLYIKPLMWRTWRAFRSGNIPIPLWFRLYSHNELQFRLTDEGSVIPCHRKFSEGELILIKPATQRDYEAKPQVSLAKRHGRKVVEVKISMRRFHELRDADKLCRTTTDRIHIFQKHMRPGKGMVYRSVFFDPRSVGGRDVVKGEFIPWRVSNEEKYIQFVPPKKLHSLTIQLEYEDANVSFNDKFAYIIQTREPLNRFNEQIVERHVSHWSTSWDPLHKAIRLYPEPKSLESHNLDVNGNTVLHTAIRFERWKWIKYILENVNLQDEENFQGLKPIHIAIKKDYLKAFIELTRKNEKAKLFVFRRFATEHKAVKILKYLDAICPKEEVEEELSDSSDGIEVEEVTEVEDSRQREVEAGIAILDDILVETDAEAETAQPPEIEQEKGQEQLSEPPQIEQEKDQEQVSESPQIEQEEDREQLSKMKIVELEDDQEELTEDDIEIEEDQEQLKEKEDIEIEDPDIVWLSDSDTEICEEGDSAPDVTDSETEDEDVDDIKGELTGEIAEEPEPTEAKEENPTVAAFPDDGLYFRNDSKEYDKLRKGHNERMEGKMDGTLWKSTCTLRALKAGKFSSNEERDRKNEKNQKELLKNFFKVNKNLGDDGLITTAGRGFRGIRGNAHFYLMLRPGDLVDHNVVVIVPSNTEGCETRKYTIAQLRKRKNEGHRVQSITLTIHRTFDSSKCYKIYQLFKTETNEMVSEQSKFIFYSKNKPLKKHKKERGSMIGNDDIVRINLTPENRKLSPKEQRESSELWVDGVARVLSQINERVAEKDGEAQTHTCEDKLRIYEESKKVEAWVIMFKRKEDFEKVQGLSDIHFSGPDLFHKHLYMPQGTEELTNHFVLCHRSRIEGVRHVTHKICPVPCFPPTREESEKLKSSQKLTVRTAENPWTAYPEVHEWIASMRDSAIQMSGYGKLDHYFEKGLDPQNLFRELFSWIWTIEKFWITHRKDSYGAPWEAVKRKEPEKVLFQKIYVFHPIRFVKDHGDLKDIFPEDRTIPKKEGSQEEMISRYPLYKAAKLDMLKYDGQIQEIQMIDTMESLSTYESSPAKGHAWFMKKIESLLSKKPFERFQLIIYTGETRRAAQTISFNLEDLTSGKLKFFKRESSSRLQVEFLSDSSLGIVDEVYYLEWSDTKSEMKYNRLDLEAEKDPKSFLQSWMTANEDTPVKLSWFPVLTIDEENTPIYSSKSSKDKPPGPSKVKDEPTVKVNTAPQANDTMQVEEVTPVVEVAPKEQNLETDQLERERMGIMEYKPSSKPKGDESDCDTDSDGIEVDED